MTKEEKKQKAIEMYQSGMGSTTIARLLESKDTVVIGWLKAAGVQMRHQKVYDKELIAQYGKRYVAGEKAADLAKEMGITRKCFTTQMNKNGYKLGPKEERVPKDTPTVPDYLFYVPTNRCVTNKVKVKEKSYTDCTYEFVGG